MTKQASDRVFFENELQFISLSEDLKEIPGLLRKINLPATQERLIFNSTACWRGYIANWLIKEDTLYLHSVEGKLEMLNKEPIKATWFSGDIQICKPNYYDGTASKELVFVVEAGSIIRN